jgi:curved DNA-binding protein CbpA
MNPYEILGLPDNATDSQIKNAYRRLVKEYHPDRNKSNDAHHRISEINQAYEILSDPVKRARYDNPFQYFVATEETETEDPVEVYKREFKRKRWEEERAEKIRKENKRANTHRIMRFVTMPILIFAVVLMADRWLPEKTIEEVAESGFPEIDSTQGSFSQHSICYMSTAHFTFRVDNHFHASYPYYSVDKPALKIYYTPVFRIPRFVAVTVRGNYNYFEIRDNIHSSPSSAWLLLISSLFTVSYRKYTNSSYSLSFVPIFLFVTTLMRMRG